MSKDYYNILGVSKEASQADIKKAFRVKAHQHHPDKKDGNEEKFKEINEAYQVVGDEKKRAQYDQFGSAFDPSQAGGYGGGSSQGYGGGGVHIDMDDLGDMFEGIGDMFGFGGGGRSRQTSYRGQDLEIILNIDFMEAVHGVEKNFKLKKKIICDSCKGNGAEPGTKIETCKTCQGKGKVMRVQRTILGNMQVQTICSDCQGEGKTYAKKCSTCVGGGIVEKIVDMKIKIPAGINQGERIRLTGQGDAGQKGTLAGDLFIKMQITPDDRFERLEYNIKTKTEISFSQAALGDKIKIETIHGTVNLKIPAGTQSHTIFKLREKGIPKLQGRRAFGSDKGDHLVEIIVKTPTSLTKKQKDLFRSIDN